MDTVKARVVETRPLADQVVGLVLQREDQRPFVDISAGAHVLLTLPSGLRRAYSLINAPGVQDHLAIAVQLETEGRGGSKEVFALKPGDVMRVSLPANNFALDDSDRDSILIAGGIGITPIWSMVQQLEAERRPWQLHYGVRSRARAAFLDELEALELAAPGRVHLAFSIEGDRLDLDAIVETAGSETGVYCCGPDRIVERFRQCSTNLGDRAHVEDFSIAEVAEGGFEVELARSGRTVFVEDGTSILEAVLNAGVEPEYSCMSGTCGSCETGVLGGTPDHRDYLLSDEEKLAGDRMMICCSGSLCGRLILDL